VDNEVATNSRTLHTLNVGCNKKTKMRQIIQILIILTVVVSCIRKEKPFLHEKTTPLICDNKYYIKLLNTEVDKDHIVPSDDGKGFYTITENGVARYDIEGLQKKWEKSLNFRSVIKHFIRSDKKIWVLSCDNPGPYYRYKTVYLIDTLANIFLTKKVNMFANNIVGDNINGFILAYTGYDSIEWVNNSMFQNLDKYFVESYDELGNLLWKKDYSLKAGSIESLSFSASNDILIGGYTDSLASHGGHGKAYLAKLNNIGVIKWIKTYPPDNKTQVFSIKAILEQNLQSYNLLISGTNSFFLAKTDTSGLIIWNTEISGYFHGNNNLLYTSNNFIVLNSNQNDINVSCINEIGKIQWTKTYGGTGIESASSIIVTPSLDLFISGTSENWDGVKYDPIFSDYFIRTDKNGNSCQ
jgi:hypothetical protein